MEASIADPTAFAAQMTYLADDDAMSEWATTQYLDKYSWKDEAGDPTEVWPDTAYRVVRHVMGALGYTDRDPEFQGLVRLISQRKFIPGGRYLANAGKPKHFVNNCFMYRCADSIAGDDGWADLVSKCIRALSSGGGVGIVYSDVRGCGQLVKATGNMATGPLSPACMVNEVARHVMAGSRRSAIWGGLHWDHPDIFRWIAAKDWSDEIKAAKKQDYNSPAPLDMTNISVILDSKFFTAYNNERHPQHELAQKVYWTATEHMLRHGEPGFSINVGQDDGEDLRNPCCEVTSYDDSDVCCLGSINLARIESPGELAEATALATLFLLAGTVYSDVPHEEVERIRSKNRRIGLGLMGVHEWLIMRGYGYETTPELEEWLTIWQDTSDECADVYADKHGLSRPLKKRAIAPNGTIGIVAETTTSGEPVLYFACKRRFLEDGVWKYQYVIDPTMVRMAEKYGIDPDSIETAFDLAYDPEKRIKFQADLQRYVDMGISSTINLPEPITEPEWVKHYGDIFMKYLPHLRGFTCYPDGARDGQPFTQVTYAEAKDQVGVTFEENRDISCQSGVCGV